MDVSVQYVQRQNIDVQKWDRCIDTAANGLIYGYSFYLDAMARHWDALVLNDYEAVMPVTWNRKYRITYLYQPAFCASLGIFGNNLSENVLQHFLKYTFSNYKLIEIDLNPGNRLLHPPPALIMRNTYVLDLNKPYEELYANYRETIKRNLRKAERHNCQYESDIPLDELMPLAQRQMDKISNLKNEDYRRFRNLFLPLQKRKQAVCCGVYSATNDLLSSCAYFFSHNRAYYILVGNHPNGKTMGASHYLIDRFIFQNSGKELLLDFEGSDIRNLAFFYNSFGSNAEAYPAVRFNRLPWWINWLRR